MALAVVVAADGYLRPGELLALLTHSVMPPCQGQRGAMGCWTLCLFEREQGRPSKVGQFDDS
eukprot:3097967-Lingulodinium_polyedra.AAC.1